MVGGELPVRLVVWDGSEAGPAGAPVVRLNSPDAIRRLLWAPGELGAAQAYVTGELDLDGDLNSALEHLWKVVRDRDLSGVRPTPSVLAGVARIAKAAGALGTPPEPPASQARVKGRLHSLIRDRAAISHHYDLSNDFYALILDPQMAYSSGYWTDSLGKPPTASRTPSGTSWTWSAARSGSSRACGCWTSAAAGVR